MKDSHALLKQAVQISKILLFYGVCVFLPLLFLSILICLLGIRFVLTDQIHTETVAPLPLTISENTFFPLVTVPADREISATAVIIVDALSKSVLFAKNPQFRFSPASTTKIMTAIVASEYFHPDDMLTVKGKLDPEGSGIGLIPGETITFRSLLYAMFLPSANDAAQTVANNYPGGEIAFVKLMNQKAASLGMHNTHFNDPAGLDDDNDYSSVTDMAILTETALQNPLIKQVVKQKSALIQTSDGKHSFEIKNRNILLGSYGIDGVKTGYTDLAKEVLITSVTRESHSYILVVMSSENRFGDTLSLVTSYLPAVTYLSMDQ